MGSRAILWTALCAVYTLLSKQAREALRCIQHHDMKRSTNERTPSGASCGASVTGLRLSDLNDQATVDALREAWLTHKIIAIHDFALTLDELQLVASYFGPFGETLSLSRCQTIPTSLRSSDWQARPPLCSPVVGIQIGVFASPPNRYPAVWKHRSSRRWRHIVR